SVTEVVEGAASLLVVSESDPEIDSLDEIIFELATSESLVEVAIDIELASEAFVLFEDNKLLDVELLIEIDSLRDSDSLFEIDSLKDSDSLFEIDS
ncbi:hypothetical protein, partial [Streptococcus suis]|uniref:hypothetical protein n=1 Tax=Streptococcus suis TaxID=1307 RepID=UPI0013797842